MRDFSNWFRWKVNTRQGRFVIYLLVLLAVCGLFLKPLNPKSNGVLVQ